MQPADKCSQRPTRNAQLPTLGCLLVIMALAVFALAGGAEAAIIATDNFDGIPTVDTLGSPTTGTSGQWQITDNGVGRTVIDNNSLGYNPPLPIPSGNGYGQFSTINVPGYIGTIQDTTGLALNAGDTVSIEFYMAGRSADSGPLTFKVELVGPVNLDFGNFTPSSQTSWDQVITSTMTIPATGNWGVLFTSLSYSPTQDRTTFIDSVSYSVTEIPEPASALLLALAGCFGLRRRR